VPTSSPGRRRRRSPGEIASVLGAYGVPVRLLTTDGDELIAALSREPLPLGGLQ
jgi:hypothetical protein